MADALKATCGSVCEEREGTRVGGPECAQFIAFGFFCTCTCEFCVDGDGNSVEQLIRDQGSTVGCSHSCVDEPRTLVSSPCDRARQHESRCSDNTRVRCRRNEDRSRVPRVERNWLAGGETRDLSKRTTRFARRDRHVLCRAESAEARGCRLRHRRPCVGWSSKDDEPAMDRGRRAPGSSSSARPRLALNDVEAQAWSTLRLDARDQLTLQAGTPDAGTSPSSPPAPGLDARRWYGATTVRSLASEGGHGDFSPSNDAEIELLRSVGAAWPRQRGAGGLGPGVFRSSSSAIGTVARNRVAHCGAGAG